ncbi:MAG TPA: hypothetical protein VFB93_12270 [Burkholderiales bacterium]|nr:hypothetical protein [Burkholderiales bacterium]
MHFHFELMQDHLRAELFGRKTLEETLEFVQALIGEARKSSARQILIWVRNSRPIFKLEPSTAAERFRQLAAVKGVRVALLGDSDEVRASHQYLEVLASHQGAALRAFRDEARALGWLRTQSQA